MAERCACGKRAVILHPARCQEHFLEEFEKRVRDTLITHCKIHKKARILVACSGGKDSMVCLDLLHAWSEELDITVDALAIHEGVEGYRDRTLGHLQKFCQTKNIHLKVMSFVKDRKVQFRSLSNAEEEKSGKSVCAPCGVLRRSLMNEGAQGYDFLATGHNLDDESQSVLMNVIKANHWLLKRTGARTGPADRDGFVPRIKPLFFCSEREVAIYAHVRGLRPSFEECPHAKKSFRAVVRAWLNKREQQQSGFKKELIMNAISWKDVGDSVHGILQKCSSCGQPSRGDVCASCMIVARVAI